jgi:P pilus assembly chaperone PapD
MTGHILANPTLHVVSVAEVKLDAEELHPRSDVILPRSTDPFTLKQVDGV